jgi:putative endonuclease
MSMTYVYLLQSIAHPRERYTGLTTGLRARLADHNASRSVHTAQFRPWALSSYHAFADFCRAHPYSGQP